MKRQYLVADGVWFVLALATCIESWRLTVGNFSNPGPGFLSFWAGLIMGVLSLISLIGTAAEKAEDAPSVWQGVNKLKLAVFMLSLLLYVALLNTLGFLLCTFLLLLFLFLAIEPYPWYVVLLASILSLAAVYEFFSRLLDVRLPAGVLGF